MLARQGRMEMKVIEFNNKIYYLKLTIKKYLAVNQLGVIERLAVMPSITDYLTLLNIIMEDLDEEMLYDLMDYINDNYGFNQLLNELLIDCGLISDGVSDNSNNRINNTNETEKRDVDDATMFQRQLDDMLKACLAYGMDVDTFYNLTFHEVQLFIESVNERRKNEINDRAMMDYMLASLITSGHGSVLGGGKFPTYEDFYEKVLNNQGQDEMVLEGYAYNEMLDKEVPVYKPRGNDEKAKHDLIQLAQLYNQQEGMGK